VQYRLPAAGPVDEARALLGGLEAAAAALGHQDGEVDEGEPGAAHDHRAPGLERGKVAVGGVLLGQEGQPVHGRGPRQLRARAERHRGQVALGEQDGVGDEGLRRAFQVHQLPPVEAVGDVGGAAVSSGSERCAHSRNVGPVTTGPRIRHEESVNIVMSSAWEFAHSSGDCRERQIRPAPGVCGSTTCTVTGTSPSSSGALATRRSSRPLPRGPPPTTTTDRRRSRAGRVDMDRRLRLVNHISQQSLGGRAAWAGLPLAGKRSQIVGGPG
jgi:hypothetical protein